MLAGVPHLACHLHERDYERQTSTLTPYPERVNCTQCHVRGTQPTFIETAAPAANNHWLGIPEPAKLPRSNADAPPQIPQR